jgi:hypothetical protein
MIRDMIRLVIYNVYSSDDASVNDDMELDLHVLDERREATDGHEGEESSHEIEHGPTSLQIQFSDESSILEHTTRIGEGFKESVYIYIYAYVYFTWIDPKVWPTL